METQIEIVQAVIAGFKPGAVLGDLAKIGIAMAEEAGYADYLYFRGHGIGLGFDEGPAVAPGSPWVLEPGMVFCFEPMLVKHGYGTACWEDMFHITETGADRLNEAPYRFWEKP
jgi:Xaa-Pro dipeptidase